MEHTKELIVIDPKIYGLSKDRADKIDEAFRNPVTELAALEPEYKNFENLTGEPPESTCAEAKALKMKYVKIRTRTADIHKTEKAFFLNAGRYIDAWKNRELEISKEREDKLSEIADYYINIEKVRIMKLEADRITELKQYTDDPETMYIPPELGKMDERPWNAYLESVKKEYADKKAEEIRIAEKALEDERRENIFMEIGYGLGMFCFKYGTVEYSRTQITSVTGEEFEKLLAEAKQKKIDFDAEQERIRKENESLKKEAEKREKALAKEREESERVLEVERAEREKLEKERADRELKDREEKEEAERLEKEKSQAPDKEKLTALAETLRLYPMPEVKTDEAKHILRITQQSLAEIADCIFEDIEKM